MAKEVISLKKIWTELVTHVLSTQRVYYSYTSEEFTWLTDKLINLFLDSDGSPESTYKSLVFLNRNTKYGRYALLFNQSIHTATVNKDETMLLQLCEEVKFPELEALSPQEQSQWNENIKTEMMTYNLYTDRELLSSNIGTKFNDKLASCLDEIMSFSTGQPGRYITSHTDHIVFISEMTDKVIITPTREIDILFLLLSKGNNPYTGRPVPENLKKVLQGKSMDIMLICKRAVKLGYKHEYKF